MRSIPLLTICSFREASGISVLPPIQHRGVGTSQVESLHHYLARLAHAIASSPARLVSAVWMHAGKKSANSGSYVGLRNDLADGNFLEAIESLTGVSSLRFGTTWNLKQVMCSVHSLGTSERRKWCTRCYEEWNDESSSEPLIWSFPHLSRCEIHDIPLSNRCGGCGAAQPWLRAYKTRRRCVGCDCPLTRTARFASELDVARKFETWVDSLLRDIALICSSPDQGIVPWQNIEGLEAAYRADGKSRRVGSRCAKLRRTVVSRGRIHFRTLVNLCAVFSMRPAELLYAPRCATSPPLFQDGERFKELPLPRQEYYDNAKRLALVLGELIADIHAPLLPLNVIAGQTAKEARAVMSLLFDPVSNAYRAAYIGYWGEPPGNEHFRASRRALELAQIRRSQGQALEPKQIGPVIQKYSKLTNDAAEALAIAACRFVLVLERVKGCS